MSLQVLDKYMQHGGFSNPNQAKRVITKAIKHETKLLDKRWHCGVWQHVAFSVSQFPVFLLMAETVRRMAATKDGLLMMTLRGTGLAGGNTETAAAYVNGQWVADLAANPWFEPSLATEGMLWFPNLLVPDPTGFLPFILSAVMFTNIYVSKSSTVGSFENASSFARNFRKFMLGICLIIGPLCQYLPSGLILYWVSSTSSAMLWNAWLDRKYPVAPGFGPCKRKLVQLPLRLTRK
jgi:inner membrane protein COX18